LPGDDAGSDMAACRYNTSMLIGILSDTHGRIKPVRQAIEVFHSNGVGAVFHCGDIGGVDILRELAAFTKRFWFVWGNTDVPDNGSAEAIAELGLTWPNGPIVVELARRRIALAHGHEVKFLLLQQDPSLDYILSGHTHDRSDRREGHVRYINPGALHRAAVHTVATLNLATDELLFHTLPR
jgi:putative phosphoesterase